VGSKGKGEKKKRDLFSSGERRERGETLYLPFLLKEERKGKGGASLKKGKGRGKRGKNRKRKGKAGGQSCNISEKRGKKGGSERGKTSLS